MSREVVDKEWVLFGDGKEYLHVIVGDSAHDFNSEVAFEAKPVMVKTGTGDMVAVSRDSRGTPKITKPKTVVPYNYDAPSKLPTRSAAARNYK